LQKLLYPLIVFWAAHLMPLHRKYVHDGSRAHVHLFAALHGPELTAAHPPEYSRLITPSEVSSLHSRDEWWAA
jgi:hypothetical protein